MSSELFVKNEHGIECDAPVKHGPQMAFAQERDAAKSESRWALIISLLFYVVALFGVFHHEMWRDEFQAWMIATSSHSVMELLSNLRYEGAGCLWHLCLFAIAQFTDKPFSMQILNVSIASCGAYIVARYAPFPRWQRVLLVFSYFSLFEYGVISRCYSLGNTLLFAACATLTQRHKWSLIVALVLFGLAANTSLFAALISFALVAGICIVSAKKMVSAKEMGSAKSIAALAFAALGIFAVLQLCPPADGFLSDWNLWGEFFGHDPTLERLLLSLASALIGYFPVPDPRYGYMFRDSTIFGGTDMVWRSVWAVVSTAIVGIFAASLWRSKSAFLAYVAGTASMIAFFQLVLLGSVRHDGQLFILLVCCLWIGSLNQGSLHRYAAVAEGLAGKPGFPEQCKKLASPLFTTILLCQFGMAVFALSIDYNHVFSPAVDLARYLKQNHRERDFIAVIPDWLGVGVSGALNRSVYELGAGRLSTFTTGGAKKDLSKHPQVLAECDRVLEREHLGGMLLVIDGRLNASNEKLEVTLLKSFRNGILMYERMYLYSVKPVKSKSNKQ